ncbi:unnamed protein product [Anisakis simplex]|uniref:G_PROTEIN_RECEP_F1_2 domain-containing protein n=1 Tax=Anisakis simplex TaxID=6269 RepID=A0A0M3K7Z3_ANISI|nr:unnamed protein product [Anisakis simplex]
MFVFSRSSVFICLITLTLATFLLLSPIIINTFAEEIVLKEIHLESPDRLVRVRIFKCIDNIEGDLFTAFILYMFVLGFAIPVFLIVLFYALLVRRLVTRSRSIPASQVESFQVPVNRIAIYTMAISVFFVVCWSPYWIATLYGLYRSKQPHPQASTTFIYVMYGIHALPYVNSASNWLLYGLLNGELMRRADTRRRTISKIDETRQQILSLPKSPLTKTVDDSNALPRNTDSLL